MCGVPVSKKFKDDFDHVALLYSLKFWYNGFDTHQYFARCYVLWAWMRIRDTLAQCHSESFIQSFMYLEFAVWSRSLELLIKLCMLN